MFVRGSGRREGRGRTQAEPARRRERRRTFVGSAERGERNVSALNVRRIADVPRVPPPGLPADSRD
jgi:hypothetical protein